MRIAVTTCALNHVDVDIREGTSRFPIDFPHILGLEIVGRIDAVGEGVEDFAVGDRVMPYLLGGEVFLGVAGPGGFAEYAIAPTGQLVRVPEEISDDDAGALQVAFGTAWHMLFTRGGLRIGETVMVNSVSSGIGSAAIQLAHLAGAFVIGTSSSPEKLASRRRARHGRGHRLHDRGHPCAGGRASPAARASTSCSSTSAGSCSRRPSSRWRRTGAS